MNEVKRLVMRLFGEEINEDDVLNPGGIVRVKDLHLEAKEMIVCAAEERLDRFFDSLKEGGCVNSAHLKKIEFYNETEKDMNTAYTAILKAALREVLDEIDRVGV